MQLEIEVIRRMRGIDAGAELWKYSTAELWNIHNQVGATVKKRKPTKEELINAILAVTHPAPAVELVKVEQPRMF